MFRSSLKAGCLKPKFRNGPPSTLPLHVPAVGNVRLCPKLSAMLHANSETIQLNVYSPLIQALCVVEENSSNPHCT